MEEGEPAVCEAQARICAHKSLAFRPGLRDVRELYGVADDHGAVYGPTPSLELAEVVWSVEWPELRAE
ncbi:hypothetical protein [Streptomyces carpinensis]|uniref:Uncharacterized protein n=1 Tax=Streptomyces carpinensis TaxID=66369 RepID=A0ABV1W1J7_9ACTN|nr:hypothetical protein [Streptomyces carpinensis]